MNTMLKELFEEVQRPAVVLTVIENTGVVVDNSNLPTGCRYCELREEQSWTHLY